MSGYSSKAEVVEVIKSTISTDHNRLGISTDPRDYNISAIVRENFIGGASGWGNVTSAEEFTASLRRNLRRSSRR